MFTGVVGQVKQQNLFGAESGPKSSGTDDSTTTFDTTKFYPGEVPFRNQGTSTSPLHHVTQRETSGKQLNAPSVMGTTRNLPPQQNMGKGGKEKEFA